MNAIDDLRSKLEEKLSKTDFKQFINNIDLNNIVKLNELSKLVGDNKKQITKCKAQIYGIKNILDDLLTNYTELFEKTDSIDNYIHGIIDSVVIELQDHRKGFHYLFKGLGIPYDDIQGWNDKSYESDNTRKTRRSYSESIKTFLRKIFTKKGREKNGT